MLISYYGRLADSIGMAQEECALPGGIATAGALRGWLAERRGGYADLTDAKIRIAADDRFVEDVADIANAAQIAFLPPVGGG